MHIKPRIVVDSNVFVSGVISPAGIPGAILAAWRRDRVTLLIAPLLLAEYGEVLRRPALRARHHKSDAALSDLFMEVLTSAQAVTPLSPLPLASRDPDDDVLLAIALGGGAHYLVTSDDDLLSLRDHEALGSLRIVTPQELIALLSA